MIAYDSEDEALTWANDSEYGLGSSVWTSNPDRDLECARKVEAGSTFINSHAFDSLDLRMPFGGIKQSGIGREFGAAGMSEYVEEHSIRRLNRAIAAARDPDVDQSGSRTVEAGHGWFTCHTSA